MQLFYFFVYALHLIVLHLRIPYNSNNSVKSAMRAMSEIFNSLEGFSLERDASRGWKKLASRYIVSGTARSEDNENNRHLFVSSVVVVSSTYITYVCWNTYEMTTIFLPFIHACIHTSSSVIEEFYMRAQFICIIYHTCVSYMCIIQIKCELFLLINFF